MRRPTRWPGAASTPSGRWRWTPSKRPSPAIPARRWRSRPPPTSSGIATSSTTRGIPTGPTATGSCCRAATPRCCCTRCSISPATTCRSTIFGRSGSGARRRRATPSGGTRPGVETTTGPLGQGVGNAVGMAIAERFLAEHFNRPGHRIIDHRTWAFASDGDLMEGVSHEALVARGAPAARQAHAGLRRQPHHDRRRHRARVQRGRPAALRGLRLARAPRRRRQRPRAPSPPRTRRRSPRPAAPR